MHGWILHIRCGIEFLPATVATKSSLRECPQHALAFFHFLLGQFLPASSMFCVLLGREPHSMRTIPWACLTLGSLPCTMEVWIHTHTDCDANRKLDVLVLMFSFLDSCFFWCVFLKKILPFSIHHPCGPLFIQQEPTRPGSSYVTSWKLSGAEPVESAETVSQSNVVHVCVGGQTIKETVTFFSHW